jgi:hydroxyacylglutathione hydrolase
MLEITPVRAFEDNYIWMLASAGSDLALAVDPGDETPVLKWLQAQGKSLGGVLITHHHYDHTGGLPELLQAYPGIPVYGPAGESIRGISQPVKEGDRVAIDGCETAFRVMEVPGHTAGHIAYYGEGALFCGDTLFAGGCGRVFDGTFEQLAASLQRIAQLPPETLIYCAHEYTLANLGFAAWVEPESGMLHQRIAQEQEKREARLPTLPSSLAQELQTNPFLRTSVPSVKGMAEKVAGTVLADDTAVFTALRQWKDSEYD